MEIMKVIIRFTSDELRMIIYSIKEICNEIDLFEFRARIGSSQTTVIAFNDKIMECANRMNCNYMDIEVSTEELRIINNALNEVCNGFKVLNFEDKMGHPRDIARMFLDKVNHVLQGIR